MKKILIYFFVVCIVILLLACENQNHDNNSSAGIMKNKIDSTLQQKIEKLNRILDKAMLSGDYESLLPYYADDIIVSPALHPPVIGKEALKESYIKNKKEEIKYHSFSGTIEDLWECSNKLYERGKFGFSVSSKNHPKPVAYYGSYFTIWEMQSDESVKIKFVMWNLDFIPYE